MKDTPDFNNSVAEDFNDSDINTTEVSRLGQQHNDRQEFEDADVFKEYGKAIVLNSLGGNGNISYSSQDIESPKSKKEKHSDKVSLLSGANSAIHNDDDYEVNSGSETDSLSLSSTSPINSPASEEINLKLSDSDIEANKMLDDPPKITREQWIRVLVVFAAVLSDGLSLTLVQPFLPELLQNRWGFSESQSGFVAGLLIGIYSLARFFSSFGLGHLSDKYGRKPFLLLSLVSTAIGTMIFAFMPNVYLGMAVRFIEGVLSNTTALCQATLADMIDRRNRATIFAYLGAIFALSRCISSSLGGFVVKLAEGQPNPYVYPCIIGGGIVMLSAILMFFLHPETHPKFAKAGVSLTELPKVQQDFSLLQGLRILSKDSKIMMLLLLGSINSFCNGGLLLSIVLFATLSIKNHGLGMSASDNGIIFSILGLIGFVFQITFFKSLSKSIGLKKQYLLGTVLLCIGMMVFPLSYTGYLIQGKAMVWVLLCIIIPFTSIGFMQCLPIIGGMVANAANAELQGLTQGTAQSLNSLLRSLGPAVSGAIFTLSVTYEVPILLFIFLSFLYLILAIIGLYLPPSVDINSKASS